MSGIGPLRGRRLSSFLTSSSTFLNFFSISSYHSSSAPHSSPSIDVTVSSESRQSFQEAMRMFQSLMRPSRSVSSSSGMLCERKIIHQRASTFLSDVPSDPW